MIYRLIDLPRNVLGFKTQWKITDKDIEEVVTPSISHHLKMAKQPNCLLVLNNVGEDIKFNTLKIFKRLNKCATKFKRIAIVSESKLNKKLIKFLNLIFRSEFKEFSNSELNDAITWSSQVYNKP